MNQLYANQVNQGYGPQIAPLTPGNMKSAVSEDGERWTVTLNCKYFKPEDLHIKTVGAAVEVKAKHEEQQDEAGGISREFNRKYHLPAGVDPLLVESQLTYDGMLIISAPLPNAKPSGPADVVQMNVQRQSVQ